MNGLYKGLYDKLDELMDKIGHIRDDISRLEDEILNTDIPEEEQNNIVTSLVLTIDYLMGAYHSANDALEVMEHFINL